MIPGSNYDRRQSRRPGLIGIGALSLVSASFAAVGYGGAPALAEQGFERRAAVRQLSRYFTVNRMRVGELSAPHERRLKAWAETRDERQFECVSSNLYPGLRWCAAWYKDGKWPDKGMLDTGFNVDRWGRVVFVASRFYGATLSQTISAWVARLEGRFGTASGKHCLGGACSSGENRSMIVTWGNIRLVPLTRQERCIVATPGASLRKGYIIDHTRNYKIRESAAQGAPIYKIEGTAGAIVLINRKTGTTADLIMRHVYQPAFAEAVRFLGKPAIPERCRGEDGKNDSVASDDLKKKMGRLEAEIKRLNARNRELAQEVSRLKNRTTDSGGQCRPGDAEVMKRLREVVLDQRKRIALLRERCPKENRSCTQRLRLIQASRAEVEQERDRLKKRVKSWRDRTRALRKKVERYEEEIRKLKAPK